MSKYYDRGLFEVIFEQPGENALQTLVRRAIEDYKTAEVLFIDYDAGKYVFQERLFQSGYYPDYNFNCNFHYVDAALYGSQDDNWTKLKSGLIYQIERFINTEHERASIANPLSIFIHRPDLCLVYKTDKELPADMMSPQNKLPKVLTSLKGISKKYGVKIVITYQLQVG